MQNPLLFVIMYILYINVLNMNEGGMNSKFASDMKINSILTVRRVVVGHRMLLIK